MFSRDSPGTGHLVKFNNFYKWFSFLNYHIMFHCNLSPFRFANLYDLQA